MGHTTPALLVSAVLWLLAAYHLTLGGTALVSPATAPRVMRALYGMSLPDDDAWRYLTSMVGMLALAIGVLAAVAALAPMQNRPIVAALLLLQLGRILCRIRDRRLLATSLGVSGARNLAAIAVLAAECAVLGTWLR
ncbi:MAG: hypothetical protein JWN79_2792 [Gemmatimonadetes bacterium]|jgi:hypothetical protein|nr:hypothetical protein [Gemmatimonadota bacterium]